MDISFKQLQVFLAVARRENLSLAAGDVFLTKGAVSQSLAELEKHLGVKLFDRAHPRLRLNHEGARLLPLADELVHRARDIEHLFGVGRGGRYLRVGASKTIGNYLLPGLLGDFERAAGWLPDTGIANSKELCDLVASFALDVALLEGEAQHQDLVFEDWLADQMVVVARKGHPLAGGARHHPRVLRGERWILREADSGTREYFEYNLGPLIAPYDVAMSLDSPEAILGMVAQGLGLTFVSRIIVELPAFAERFAVIRLNRAFSRTFSICWHRRKYRSAGMDEFLGYALDWTPAT